MALRGEKRGRWGDSWRGKAPEGLGGGVGRGSRVNRRRPLRIVLQEAPCEAGAGLAAVFLEDEAAEATRALHEPQNNRTKQNKKKRRDCCPGFDGEKGEPAPSRAAGWVCRRFPSWLRLRARGGRLRQRRVKSLGSWGGFGGAVRRRSARRVGLLLHPPSVEEPQGTGEASGRLLRVIRCSVKHQSGKSRAQIHTLHTHAHTHTRTHTH